MSSADAILGWIGKAGIPHVGVAFRRGGTTFFLEADREFHAASMMKVPVMFEAFRQDAAGLLRLEEFLPVENCFKSVYDGCEFTLSKEDDSETKLYDQIGDRVVILDLIMRMITQSSNLATNILIECLGAAKITESANRLGAADAKVIRGVEDKNAYRAGLNNTMTARAYLTLMDRLIAGEVVSASASRQMLDIMSRQSHREAIPSGLPPRTKVAHKTGWNTGIFHDGGVVYAGESPSFSLAVFTQGAASKEDAQSFVAELTKRLNNLE